MYYWNGFLLDPAVDRLVAKIIAYSHVSTGDSSKLKLGIRDRNAVVTRLVHNPKVRINMRDPDGRVLIDYFEDVRMVRIALKREDVDVHRITPSAK